MFIKSKTVFQMTRLVLTIVLGLAFAVPNAPAFDNPWSGGHKPANPEPPRPPEPPRCEPCADCTSSPVFAEAGNYFLVFNDFALPGRGPNVTIGRTYNSQDLRSGPSGRGWTLSFGARLIPVIDKNGNEIKVIRLPNGQRRRFTENPDGTYTPPFGVTSTLVKNDDGTYALTEKHGTRHEFDADGKLTAIVDRNNNQISFSYDESGCLEGITDAAGDSIGVTKNSKGGLAAPLRSLEVAKNANGKISTVTDSSGRTFTYEYDENGNLIRVTDPLANTTSYAYDSKNRLTNTTDARGNLTRTITYDDQDRVITFTEGAETYTMTYLEGQTNKTDSHGNTWQYFYNEMGMVGRIVDPLGNETTRKHNDIDPTQYDWEVDANGNRYQYTYDEKGNRTSAADPLGNVTTYTYEPNFNQVETKTDARGVVTKYEYDANGNPTKVIRAFGTEDETTTTYTYDEHGNRTSMTDPNGNIWTYTYDDKGNLLTATDPLGHTTAYTYDERGNTLTVTDANGNTTSHQYDAMNRLVATTDALGNTTQRVYDENGNLISETAANGHTIFYDYDIHNRLVRATDPLGNVTTLTYNTKGKATSVTDANGKVTYYKYDALSRLVKVVRKVNDTADTEDNDDAVTQYGYDNVGNQTSITDPNGNTTTSAYDALNRLISQSNPLGETISNTYDALGNKVTETSPHGNVVSNTYDSLNRVISESDSVGLIETYTYDAVGNLLTQQDANGNVTTYEYDESNRKIKEIDAMGEETSYHYDNVGNLLRVTDREGNTISYNYDAINRRISTTDALANTTSYQYDSVGNLVKIIDANGNATDYEYDAVRRLIKESYADGGVRTFTHNAIGKVTSATDQNGVVILNEYNDLYFLTKRDYPTDPDCTFTYDKSGRILTAEKGGWLVTFQYDSANRIIQTTQNGQTISYAYDVLGPARTITYPGGRVITEQLDLRGRLLSIDDAASPPPIVQYSYDPGDRITRRTYRNGVVANYTYNANDWTVELEHSLDATRIAGFGLGYDREGNKLFEEKRHDPTRSESYQYDAAYRLVDYKVGQLTGATVTAPDTQTAYDLDRVGNWNSKTTDGITENRTHNAVNELTKVDAVDLSYDDNGNMQEDYRYTYTYDEENRLIRVTRKADGQVVGEYQYDALGRRVVKVANPAGVATETRYFYDDWRVIEEQDNTGVTQATYTYGNYVDEALTMERGGRTYYYHQSALWSVAAVTDRTGNVVERYAYDPYGSVTITDGAGAAVSANPWDTPHSAIGNPYIFAGRRLDEETGLYYYRARYYDCAKGRFLERDSLGYAHGMNLYEYNKGNPLVYLDPYGHYGVKWYGRSYEHCTKWRNLRSEPQLYVAYDPSTGCCRHISVRYKWIQRFCFMIEARHVRPGTPVGHWIKKVGQGVEIGGKILVWTGRGVIILSWWTGAGAAAGGTLQEFGEGAETAGELTRMIGNAVNMWADRGRPPKPVIVRKVVQWKVKTPHYRLGTNTQCYGKAITFRIKDGKLEAPWHRPWLLHWGTSWTGYDFPKQSGTAPITWDVLLGH